MKANVFTSVVVALFLFAINTWVVKADSDTDLYHNVEQIDNTISTTYYKGNGDGLVPFKKRVNTLNETGLCVSKVTYVWDSLAGDWAPLDRMDYVYEGENVTNVDRYAWNTKAKNWGTPQKVSYNYDENGVSAK